MPDVKNQLRRFLAEDIRGGDITSALLAKTQVRAEIIPREKAVIAGTKFAGIIFGLKNARVKILESDGTEVRQGQPIMTISGDARNILECERTALNLLARMSGIATQTRLLTKKIPGKKLYATRKTAPGLRYFDKMAVEIGGGYRHRMGLDEMIMIKDNHIASESLESLIEKARKSRRKFEVEVEDTAGAVLAAGGGASAVMLDNFTPSQIRETIRILERKKLRDGIILEASGGINADNIREFGRTRVDIISVGSITSSARGIDMSLEIIRS